MLRTPLFADAANPLGGFLAEHFLALALIAVGLFAFSTLMFVAKRYRRCPPNRVLVIFGKVRRG